MKAAFAQNLLSRYHLRFVWIPGSLVAAGIAGYTDSEPLGRTGTPCRGILQTVSAVAATGDSVFHLVPHWRFEINPMLLTFHQLQRSRLSRPSLARALIAWVVAALPSVALAVTGPAVKQEHVVARAMADRSALVPGETAQLAVVLKIEKDWHVYWRNTGGYSGIPTLIVWNDVKSVDWKGPDPFKFGPVQYPAPKFHQGKLEEDIAFVHEDTAYFLVDVTAPASAPVGKEVEFSADVSWLVCRESCVGGKATVTLKMPVVAKGTKVVPANVEAFKSANRALPTPMDQAKYLKLTGALDRSTVKPGDKVTATLTATVDAGHHIQSNKPLSKALVATYVFVDPPEGLDLDGVSYPPGKERMAGKETFSEYAGKVEFKMSLTVSSDIEKTPRWLRGVLRYQACDDSGTCFLPQNVAFAIPIQIEGGPAPSSADADAPVKPTKAATGGTGDSATGDGTGNKAATAGTTETHANLLTRAQDWLAGFGILGILAMGFIGGVILNVMPCVLPVISLKVLSFVRQAHEDRWRILQLGLTYAAGIMTFFVVLAALFVKFQKGWGSLFQDPNVVIVLAAIVFAFSLSLFGVFAIFTPKVISDLGAKAEGESLGSAFATGVLATMLGTACTGPFLSAAVGYASRLPATQGAMVFIAVGLGMAFPFILLSAQPAWVRFVPKPGPWMKTFEDVMGFVLLGTVIWLLNPLRNQIGGWGMMMTMIFFIGVAAACFIKGRIGWGDSTARKIRLYVGATAILAISWLVAFGADFVPFGAITSIRQLVSEQREQVALADEGAEFKQFKKQLESLAANHNGGDGTIPLADITKLFEQTHYDLSWERGIPWQKYKPERIRKAVMQGYTVFVDYTADWCGSCKTNKSLSINVDSTRSTMKQLGVVPFEADYTNYDDTITADLAKFQRAGVPLYLVYRPFEPEKPEVLPETLTPSLVIDALQRAGPSKPIATNGEKSVASANGR